MHLKSQLSILQQRLDEQRYNSVGYKLQLLLNNHYYVLSSLAVLLFLLIGFVSWPRHSRGERKAIVNKMKNASSIDQKVDYDYMGSNDAIPVKLDLARAYIAMSDHEQAKEVLEDVIRHAVNPYKQEAKTLLEALEEGTRA